MPTDRTRDTADSDAASGAPRAAPAWRELPLPDEVLRAREVGTAPCQDDVLPATAFTVIVCTYRRPESTVRFLHSLEGQLRAHSLLLVDASEDDRTERAVAELADPLRYAGHVAYYRVDERGRGISRQQNFALSLVRTPLAARFDDDVVLLPGCLAALVDAHARCGTVLAGVGAAIENEPARPRIWRARRLLGVVPSLAPGRFFPSGVSTPWGFVEPGERLIDGDWLPGGALMCRTAVARAVGLDEALGGYGCGNDLVFSRRLAAHGRLVLASAARVLHLQEPAGRPDTRAMAYEAERSAHAIHRAFVPRRLASRLWFAWATFAGALLAATGLVRPGHARSAAAHLRGVAAYWLGRGDGRPTLSPHP